MKNCPRVECRRVSISMGAIYKAAYGTLSRRAGRAMSHRVTSRCLASICEQALKVEIIVLHMLRDDNPSEHQNDTSVWIDIIDRGGLWHVNAARRLFIVMRMIID